mgnify:CR=1 FL=1
MLISRRFPFEIFLVKYLIISSINFYIIKYIWELLSGLRNERYELQGKVKLNILKTRLNFMLN